MPVIFLLRALAAGTCALLTALAAAAPSTQLRIGGQVATPTSYDIGTLSALPALTQTDMFLAGSTPLTHVYTGEPIWSLLKTAGARVDPAAKNDVLGMYAVATGSDGYKVVFSLGEIDPLFGNQPALVAFGVNGHDLDADGFAHLVVPNDVRRGRYVSNLVSLEVFHAAAVPEPSTMALMLADLVGASGGRVVGASRRP